MGLSPGGRHLVAFAKEVLKLFTRSSVRETRVAQPFRG